MSERGYGLILEDIRVLRELIRWWRGRGGSRRPVPTRRRVRGGGRSSLQIFKATTGISAATGLLAADRGSGTVQPLNNATGAAAGDPIEISNPGFDAFDVDSVGWMNTSTSPPLIVSVFCSEAS